MAQQLVSAEVVSVPDRATEAARSLQRLGFQILHIGPTVSVRGPADLWSSAFNVTFEPHTKPGPPGVEGGEVRYLGARTEDMRIPAELRDAVADVIFVEPPELFSAP